MVAMKVNGMDTGNDAITDNHARGGMAKYERVFKSFEEECGDEDELIHDDIQARLEGENL